MSSAWLGLLFPRRVLGSREPYIHQLCMIPTIVSSRPLLSPLFVFSETILETFGVCAGELFRFSSTEVPTRVSRSIVRITFLCSCRQNLSTITDAHELPSPLYAGVLKCFSATKSRSPRPPEYHLSLQLISNSCIARRIRPTISVPSYHM